MTVLAQVLCMAVLSLGYARAEVACEHMDTVVEAAEHYALDPALMVALIRVESRWKATAVSRANACGLTQVLAKYTRPRLSCKKLKDPKTSIWIGAKKLNYWIYKYGKGNLRTGLCGYNAGYRCKGRNKNKTGYYRYAPKVLKYRKQLVREMDNILIEENESQTP